MFRLFRGKHKNSFCCTQTPSVYHAAVVIFLEFFAFGLLTAPMISVLDEAFPKNTFLMNGIIQGIKGFLSFLSAPLIGAMSDIFGRKPFLFLTVTFTCSPIPLIKLSYWWYFTMISISGIFSVTFSVVLAFVSDVTTIEDRSCAYGLVSATFAASLIISPALGAYLEKAYSENLVIVLATLIAFLDVLFVLICVPESLHFATKHRANGSPLSPVLHPPPPGRRITWEKVDPFAALRRMSQDRLTLMVCVTTFLSYLPEAGEYSCFFVYLRLVIGFSEENVALFIAICGLVSCIAQTCGLGLLISCLGAKHAIIIGLAFEAAQLATFGFSSSTWMLWTAGGIAGLGSITYPGLSAFLSNHVNADQQGLAQGLLTGIRGLCGGLGPALYGLIFFIFQVDLNFRPSNQSILGALPPPQPPMKKSELSFQQQLKFLHESMLPGPPFAFGAVLVLMAIIVAIFIPEKQPETGFHHSGVGTIGISGGSSQSNNSADLTAAAGSHNSTDPFLELKEIAGANEADFNVAQDDGVDEDDEKASFIGYVDRRRRLGDKRDIRRVCKSDESKEVGFLQGIMAPVHAHLPRLLLRSKSKHSGLVAPLRRLLFFSSSQHHHLGSSLTRIRPESSAGSYSRSGIGGDFNDLTDSGDVPVWRETTEAADLANYRQHRMQDLMQSVSTAASLTSSSLNLGDTSEVPLSRRADLLVGRRSFISSAAALQLASDTGHRELPHSTVLRRLESSSTTASNSFGGKSLT